MFLNLFQDIKGHYRDKQHEEAGDVKVPVPGEEKLFPIKRMWVPKEKAPFGYHSTT